MLKNTFRITLGIYVFAIITFIFISIYDQAKVRDYTPISNYTYEYPNTDFKHNGEIINSQAIHYIHTRLDQRLAYEDKFKNNVQLSDYESSTEDTMPYNPIAEVKDNIFLIQTNYHWMWGDYRHSVFLIEKNNGTLNLLDYFIPDSINDPMEYYKVNDHGVTILSGNEKIDLYFNSSKV
jgi:hypothetical protein